MKKLIKTTTIIFSIALIGFLVLTSFDNPDEDIIGTWILESDTKSKWVFINDNCYWYYENSLEETFTYTVQDLSDSLNSGLSVSLCGQEVKTGGTEEVIDNKAFDFNDSGLYDVKAGPSTRRIIDFSDVENSISILPTGQSGNPFSEHYDDQAEMYSKGDFRKMKMNQEEIMETSRLLRVSPKD